MSSQLLEQIKFVRSLQAQLGTADNGNVNEVIDKTLEEQFRKEKHLNVQLKEKLKECEVERLEVGEQLKLLEAQKEVTVVAKTDDHVDLEKAQMTFDEMVNYRGKVLRNLEEVNSEIQSLLRQEDDLVREVDRMERQVAVARTDRNRYAEQITQLKGILDDGTQMIGRDQGDLERELRRNRLMLAGKVLSNALEFAVYKTKKSNFGHFVNKMKENHCQIDSILGFRKLCLRHVYRRQEKYFNIWFRKGLKPLHQLRCNQTITNFQMRHEPLRRVMIKWNHQLIASQCVSSKQVQNLANCIESFQKYNQRELKYRFHVWKLSTKNHTVCKKMLAAFIKEKVHYRLRQALYRWQGQVQNEDFMIRLNSQAVWTTVTQYKTSLFYGWRHTALIMKKRRINLMIRTWQELKKNVQHPK